MSEKWSNGKGIKVIETITNIYHLTKNDFDYGTGLHPSETDDQIGERAKKEFYFTCEETTTKFDVYKNYCPTDDDEDFDDEDQWEEKI